MTEIVTFPLALSAEGGRRLSARLEADVRAGVDPGPRSTQIDCLSVSLARSLQELKEALARAAAELPEGDPTLCTLREAVAGVTRIAQAVMAGAVGLRPHPVAAA